MKNLNFLLVFCLFGVFFNQSSFAQVSAADYNALVALYNATNGNSWTNRTNWNISQPPTSNTVDNSWYGITVSGGRVTEIRLNNNNLVGTIPTSIGNLTNLTFLQMGFNQLSGTIPSQLWNLTNLTEIDFYNNQLTGSLPTQIGNLVNINRFIVGDNDLSGSIPTQINNLVNMTRLELQINNFSGAVPSMNALTNLTELFLYDNSFTNYPSLANSSSLTTCWVGQNNLQFAPLEATKSNPNPSDFNYSPQARYQVSQDTYNNNAGDNITMNGTISGTNNQYQWYKGASLIAGATNASYNIPSLVVGDAGVYTCRVTNTFVTGLTIISEDITVNVSAPTISVGSITPTTYCAGSTISIPFSTTGSFNAGNTFTAQLSNSSGSFTTPIATQTGTSPISLTIPTGATTGTGYRVRIIASNPSTTSSLSSSITINARPTINLSVSSNTASEAATTSITVSATASQPVVGAKTVNLTISGTGITAGDFTVSNTVITIPNGNTTGSITFTIVDDALVEGTETATLTISSPSSCAILGSITTQDIVITDNDNLPEINLQGNGNAIVDGANTTTTTNATNFGNISTCGTNSVTNTFTIQNIGGSTLTISSITITGINASDFTLGTTPTSILAGNSETFTVAFDPSAIGSRSATVTINNNDADENPYTFAIGGNGTADTTDPVIPTLATITAQCSTTPTAPTTTDNCAGTITGTTATSFPVTSSTTITWTFDDGNGNVVTADQDVVIDDTTDPVIPTLATITAQCSTTPTAPTTTDNCVGTITGTTTTSFPVTSSTTITWTFDDGNGNVVTADQDVVIDDTTDPVIPTLATITAQCSTTPTAPTTTDNCVGTITGTTTTSFPVTSSTTITWTFDDGNGNVVTADQDVVIDDTTDPVIPTLATITAQCSTTPTAPTTTDNCVGTITGTTATSFPVTSSTTITWTFDDGNGNVVTADQDIVIDDTTDPTITAPANVTVDTDTGLCTASGVVLGTPSVSDNCTTPTFTHDAPSVFPIGVTTVTWTADDGSGNTQTATQTVTVNSTREINVLGNAVSIIDGDITPSTTDNTDFGNTTLRTITYTIQNTGSETITISSIVSSGSNAGDFVVGTIPTSITAGATATFDVTFTPSGAGIRTATITINNNDCDEGIYDFAIQGSNISSGDVLLVRTGIFYPTIQQAVDVAITNDEVRMTVNRNYPEDVSVDKNLTFTSNASNYQDVTIDQILVNDGINLSIGSDMSVLEVVHLQGSTSQMDVQSTANFALRSTNIGTAMVINDGTNTITGNVTMERYLPNMNTLGYSGTGYRMFSSPFTDATISQFGDDMSLVLNTAFNGAASPGSIRPFPTFYEYVEPLAGTPRGGYNGFTVAYQVPTTTNLVQAKGYEGRFASNITVDLNGTLMNGNINMPVTNNGNTSPNGGFNLVGNPYPAPIRWSDVHALSSNIDNAIYIDVATSLYGANFASYISGVGVNGATNDIASMQGFFVYCNNAGGGTVAFDNSVRHTTYTNPVFLKEGEEQGLKEGLIKLAIEKDGKMDETAIYFTDGATPNYDGKYDALKLYKLNGASATLYSYNDIDQYEYFSINGLGNFDEEMTLPLAMNIVKGGKHTISVREIKYFHSLSEIYLYDSLTETLHDLKNNPSYEFVAEPNQEVKRFVLLFKKPNSSAFSTKGQVVVYPNPTTANFSYSLKSDIEGDITIRLFDATGRLISHYIQHKEGAFLEGIINIEKEPSGLYLIQVIDSENSYTVRVVKE